MIKKIIIAIIVVSAGLTNPVSVEKAEAQERVERKVNRKKNRRVRRKTRRRVRRRVTRRAHFAYRGLPRYRSVVKVVPRGAVIVTRKNVRYHYFNGIFYRPVNSGFTVIRPIPGVRVATLPAARKSIVVQNNQYFYYYGTFYTQNNNGYEVVDAPEGAVVDALPEGYEIAEVDGTEHYVIDDTHFLEIEDDNGTVGYEVVKV